MTHQDILDAFSYTCEGNLVWKINKSRAKVGAIFGFSRGSGYIQGEFMGKKLYAHRLIWMYHNGEMPTNEIDHINGVRSDNRIENLRNVTREINVANTHTTRSDNKLGVMGVCKHGDKYRARIKVGGKVCYRGGFSSAEEAHIEYIAMKRIFHRGFIEVAT